MYQPTIETPYPVVAPEPNRHHALNRGRVAWWLAVPGLEGGSTWYDLMGLYPGTLTTMGNANNGWRPSTRKGGLGEIKFDGTAGYVAVPGTQATFPFSISYWMKAATGAWVPAVSKGTAWFAGFNSSNQAGFRDNASGNPYFSAGTLNDALWHHHCITSASSAANQTFYYLDGVLVATGTLSTNSTQTFAIGRETNFSFFANARIDSVSIWNRVLSTAEIFADYELSREGYPGVLYRYRPTSVFLASSGAASGSATLTGTASITANPTVSESPALACVATITASPTVSESPTLACVATITASPSIAVDPTLACVCTLTATGSVSSAGATISQEITCLDTSYPVSVNDPVNRQHPLNRNRTAWWLVLPGRDGGKTFYDLLGLKHGTLTNMIAGLGWQGTTRPGGYGHMLGNATNAQVVCPLATIDMTNFTVAAWARFDDVTKKGAILKVGDNLTGIGIGVGSSTFDSSGNNFVALAETIAWIASAQAIGTGWHRLLFTFTSTGNVRKFYIDGVLRSNSTYGSGWVTAANNSYLGGYTGSASEVRYFNGPVDDLSVWNRVLTDIEAQDDYNLSRTGYPGVLNRTRHTPVLSGAASGTTGSATLTGTASITANPTVSESPTLNCVATITANPSVADQATLACVATLTATGNTGSGGSATLACVATLTASGTASLAGSAALNSVATLTAAGALGMSGNAALACVTTLNALGSAKFLGSAQLACLATLTAAGSGGTTRTTNFRSTIKRLTSGVATEWSTISAK